MKKGLVGFAFFFVLAVGVTGKPNVMFIAADDLRDWVRHLGGHPNAMTPHIDRLLQAQPVPK